MDVKDELELLKKLFLGLDVKMESLDVNDPVRIQFSHIIALLDVVFEFLWNLEKSITTEKQQVIEAQKVSV